MYISNTTDKVNFFDWESTNGELWNALTSPLAIQICYGLLKIVLLFTFVIPQITALWCIVQYWILGFLLWINKPRHPKGYSKVDDNQEKGKQAVFKYMRALGRVYHGHKIIGMENIPNGPAILVGYHGTVCAGSSFLYFELFEKNSTPIIKTVHKKEADIAGWRNVHKVFNLLPFTREEVIDHIKNGGHYQVLPGGLEESRYSDESYRLYFAKRKGYAHVAKETNAPIIPFFTRNNQEAYWIPWFAKPFFSGRFARKDIPFILIHGGLPVKLTTIVGKPMTFDASMTAEQIAEKFETEFQAFIDKFQPLPGNRLRALWDRLYAKEIDEECERLNNLP